MSYEGEFASYGPLYRIAEAERVRSLLARSRRLDSRPSASPEPIPVPVPDAAAPPPDFVVAVDGSNAEVPVRNGYPGARIGYCIVASVLLDLKMIDSLDANRPVNPVDFRETEKLSTVDAALPGSNIVTRDHMSAQDSFRETLYDEFSRQVPDEDDRQSILATYEALLKLKPDTRSPACPYEYTGCEEHIRIPPGLTSCPCSRRRAIYSTDALRIHERFHDTGANGEALGEVMQVWERVLLVHIMRSFERRGWLSSLRRLAFVMDGPLAFFGHPAWMSAAVSTELKRLNSELHSATGQDLLLLGIEKSGTFVDHFTDIDKTEIPGKLLFPPQTYFMPSDDYIKRR